MNGEYILSLTPNSKTQDKFPSHFKDYPGGAEYFDIYSPKITSLYSQVFWTQLAPVDLPADIVQRYAGRGMAVVGYEVDQVRRTPEGDVSVPISISYNHHFEAGMSGAKSKFEKIQFNGPHDPRIAEMEKENGHGLPSHEHHTIIKNLAPDNALPTSQSFGCGNGGEYRKTFHGYAPGYVQVIESPEKFMLTPMQIDTWNRDKMNLTGSPFVTGPVPRNSMAPPAGSPAAVYSGLLECPVTTRITKSVDAAYITKSAGVCAADAIQSAGECFGAVAKTLGAAGNVYVNSEVTDSAQPVGCSATTDPSNPMTINAIFNNAPSSTIDCGGMTSQMFSGASSSLVNVSVQVDVANNVATITIDGPSDVWFGIGFNASAMKDAPWAIICEGTGDVTERQLQDQNPGSILTPSITVKSNTVNAGVRSVVVTRAIHGNIFTFNPSAIAEINFINALGNGPTLAYHKVKLPSKLSLLPMGDEAGTCICATAVAPFGQAKGSLVYNPTNQSVDKGQGTIGFGNKCAPQPRSDMLAQHNPTCDVRTYAGGQSACHHMFSLLDADQEIPWVDQPLVFQHKWRFWVQPYNETYHTALSDLRWGIASPVEYDVPKCDASVMGCSQDEKGNWIHTIRGTYKGGGKLAAAHFHCHAPTCLSMAMYRCNSSIEVCNATTGELICREDPVFGGTGKLDQKKFDEQGFILQPPCIWGSPEFGLEEPVETSGYTLHTVKTSDANYGHHGEMAWQQMYYFH